MPGLEWSTSSTDLRSRVALLSQRLPRSQRAACRSNRRRPFAKDRVRGLLRVVSTRVRLPDDRVDVPMSRCRRGCVRGSHLNDGGNSRSQGIAYGRFQLVCRFDRHAASAGGFGQGLRHSLCAAVVHWLQTSCRTGCRDAGSRCCRSRRKTRCPSRPRQRQGWLRQPSPRPTCCC